jgi:hypothetical protein
LREIVLEAYDRYIGLEISEMAVDCCITKAPSFAGGKKAGRNPVDRGKRGIKRSTAVDAEGIPIAGVTDPANRHDSPLLVPTLEHASASVGGLPEGASVHLDRGYDSEITRQRLEERGLVACTEMINAAHVTSPLMRHNVVALMRFWKFRGGAHI